MSGEYDENPAEPVKNTAASATRLSLSTEREPRVLTWFVIGLALVLRLLWLGMKPPHHDEGVNGWFIDQMTGHGFYHYDPANYHGPFHFYVLFLAKTLFGRSVEVMRLPLVLANAATVWLLLQFRRFLPWRACVIAALACAVSPGMLFNSRYCIHEPWLVLGMLAAVWGAAELWTHGTRRGLWSAALGVTLMLLTKETHLIHFAAFGLAAATLAGLEWLSAPSSSELPARPVAQQWTWRDLGDTLGVCLLLLVFFFSGGFNDPAPPKELAANFFNAFAIWTKTGTQSPGHEKEWYYWLQLILRYEWPALLGLLWSVRALWPGMNRLARFLAIYGCGTLVAYSIVPYKTPWCIISLIWPFLLLFGCGIDAAIRWCGEKNRAAAWLPGVAAFAILSASLVAAAQLNYREPTINREIKLTPAQWSNVAAVNAFLRLPSYVYVQTTNDFFKLTRPLEALIAQDPSARKMPIHVLLSSTHPLPWVLGECTSVGYYENAEPPVMDAGIILAEEDRIATVEAGLKNAYFVWPFQLRDGMSVGKIYLAATRFAAIFPGRQPDFTPETNKDGDELPIVPAVPVAPGTPVSASP